MQCLKQQRKNTFLPNAIARATSFTSSLQRLHEEQYFWSFILHPHPLCPGGGTIMVPQGCGSPSTKCRRQHINRACICCMKNQKYIFLVEIARLTSSLLNDMVNSLVFVIQTLLNQSKKNVLFRILY